VFMSRHQNADHNPSRPVKVTNKSLGVFESYDFYGATVTNKNCEEFCLLRCDAVWSDRSLWTLQMNVLLPSSESKNTWLALRPWRGRHCALLESWLTSVRLHGVAFQKTALFIVAAVRTWDRTKQNFIHK
jgi:hypothetical protein